jgi:hypothetical protein
VCEYAGTIRCFFQPGQVKRDPLEDGEQPDVAHGLSRFRHSAMYVLDSSTHLATRPHQRLVTSVMAP